MKVNEYKKQINYPVSQRTLCFLVHDNQVLLGKKKTGFGQGYWLGIGGKIKDHETAERAAIRETLEEINVAPKNLEEIAWLGFYFPYVKTPKEWSQEVKVFISKEWYGEIKETEEIMPQWFDFDKIPLDKMWADAKYWLPQILKGEKIRANFIFDRKQGIQDYNYENY